MIEITEFEQVTQIRMSRELEGKAVYWVAAYLVDGVLIDTGCSHTAKELADFLEGRDLRLIVNTHYHEDHIGGNHALRERYQVEVYAHPASIPLIAGQHKLYPYQEIAWGYPVPTAVKPIPAALETGSIKLQSIDTPGHCTGHICLMDFSKGWCFTGDLFARENPKFIRPEENIGEIIRSMQKVIDAGPEPLVLFTAVGKIVEDGKKALRECIRYLTGIAAQARQLSRSGSSLDEVVNTLFGGEHVFAAMTNGQFSTYALVRSLLETVA